MIRAVVFDFDGVILDTETPAFLTWQEVFTEHGATLMVEAWAEALGGALAPSTPTGIPKT